MTEPTRSLARRHGPAAGFSLVEVLIAMVLVLGAMAMALLFFVDFGEAISTESTTLSTQQAGRIVIDELARNVRQAGYGVRRPSMFNAATWQTGIIYGGSHVLAFNADIHPSIGSLPNTQTISFPTGPDYDGEGYGASQLGAETYVYTLDADGDGTIETEDRAKAASGTHNPATETENPLDFAVFRRVYGFNGTDYGGTLEPLAPYLFTNATADIQFPADGSTPAPLFVYWMTEDLNGDGYLAPGECVNDVVDTCPPATLRSPLLYLWGDSDFDGSLSEAEKTALRTMEVGSTSWSKNIFAESGAYKSTTLAAPVNSSDPDAFELTVADGSKLGPGYHVRLGTGASAESLFIDQVNMTVTPNVALLTTHPTNDHVAGAPVEVLRSTVLRAIRTVGITYTSITDKKDSENGAAATGRAGRKGTGGLDYRVTAYHRKVEIINAPTRAMVDDTAPGPSDVCPLKILNACTMSPSEESVVYTSLGGTQPIEFIVTDAMGNPLPEINVTVDHTNASIGGLPDSEATTDGNGIASFDYVPTGALGTDTVTGEVSCLLDGTLRQASASNEVETYKVRAWPANDCLGTDSDRNPDPSTPFTVEVLSASGPVSGHDVELGLAFDEAYLPTPPDFTAVTGELFIGASSAGETGEDGTVGYTGATSDENGQVVGSVALTEDTAGKGARLNLLTKLTQPGCSAMSGTLTNKVDFFSLSLDSTVPYPGCTEYLPCTIGENSPAPRVQASLSLNDTPVPGATLTFTHTDIDPPTDGIDTAASVLLPGTEIVTDAAGLASVTVSNNASPLITPETPLNTLVDVSTDDVPSMCSSASIVSASPRAGFKFEAPANVCEAAMQQAFVQKVDNRKICVHALNDNEADGCPMEVVGLQVTIYETDGVTPHSGNGSLIRKIEGGGVTTSASCSTSNSVRLFEDVCRIPKAKLSNGELWMFTDYDNCSKPYLLVDPLSFFTIHKIEFEGDYPKGNPMDVTVVYKCQGDCATDSLESATFSLTLPY